MQCYRSSNMLQGNTEQKTLKQKIEDSAKYV